MFATKEQSTSVHHYLTVFNFHVSKSETHFLQIPINPEAAFHLKSVKIGSVLIPCLDRFVGAKRHIEVRCISISHNLFLMAQHSASFSVQKSEVKSSPLTLRRDIVQSTCYTNTLFLQRWIALYAFNRNFVLSLNEEFADSTVPYSLDARSIAVAPRTEVYVRRIVNTQLNVIVHTWDNVVSDVINVRSAQAVFISHMTSVDEKTCLPHTAL